MLTVRPRPFKGEALSGYIQRICDKNYINPMSLWIHCQQSTNRYPQSYESSQLDYCPSNKFLETMVEVTGLTKRQIQDLTFTKLIKNFFAEDEQLFSAQRILSSELNTSRRYCPICLKEKGYYHQLWQVKEITVCLDHCIYLFDRCPSCHKPVDCLYPWVQHGYCRCGFNLSSISLFKQASESEIKGQARVWRDWQEVLNSFNVPAIDGLDAKRSLATGILYVAGGFTPVFHGISAIDCLPKVRLSSLLQLARGTKSRNDFAHIRTLLAVLRAKGVTVTEFSNMTVPDSFVASLNAPRKKKLSSYCCTAPWCPSYGKSDGLVKTGTSLKIRNDGSKLKYYFYCEHCGIEYGIIEADEITERGYFIVLGWEKVKPLLLDGLPRKVIAEKTGATVDKVNRCTAYMAANGLLPGDLVTRFLGRSPDGKIEKRVIDLMKSGQPVKTIQRTLGLSYCEFLFYRYKVPVMNAINHLVNKAGPRVNKHDCHQRTRDVLEKMIKSSQRINIKLVSENLQVCPETLRLWGVLKLITKYKKEQQKLMDKRLAIEFMNKAKVYIKRRAGTGNRVDSASVYRELGHKRNVLVRKFPQVTRYIADLLKKQKQKEQKLRLETYLSTTRELIKEISGSGRPVSLDDVAEELGLSVAGVSRYPQICRLVNEVKQHIGVTPQDSSLVQ